MFTIKHTMQPYFGDRREFAIEAVSYSAETKNGRLHFVSTGPDGRDSIWGGEVPSGANQDDDTYTGSIYVMNGQGATVDVYRYEGRLDKIVDAPVPLAEAA